MKHKTQTLPNPTLNPSPKPKIMARFNSTPIPFCFRPSTTTPSLEYPHAPPSPTTTSTPNLTTSLYQTTLGIFSLTWSNTLFSRSLHLTLHPPPSLSSTSSPLSLSSPSFHLTLKPFLFWNKHGSKKLAPSLYVHWDLSQARFGPAGPEPVSGFYIAVVYDGETTLLVGDKKNGAKNKVVLRREHVFGDRFYSTKTEFGGKKRDILIELNNNNTGHNEDPRLVIRFDSKRVIQVKHLKWKFRGSERVEVDGTHIQLSWDVYNWLFEEDGSHNDEGYALFTFRFEDEGQNGNSDVKGGVIWSEDSCGLNYERKKMKKKMLVKTRSGSSSSISSTSSGSSTSVLEWESVEENELKGPTGFSLLLYAWKS